MNDYEAREKQLENINSDVVEIPKKPSNEQNSNAGFFNMFNSANNTPTQTTQENLPEGYSNTINPEEKRRRLTKRLKEMTDKLENLSNQLYHIGQRLEVVERKLEVGRY